MLLTKTFSLLAFATAALSFTISEGLIDGVYQVHIDQNGDEVYEAINGSAVYTVPSEVQVLQTRRYQRRQIELVGPGGPQLRPEFRCGCG
jgi:oxalate decarboxylase/phosphoglucose isomerase-like protein (cupin superfamily)